MSRELALRIASGVVGLPLVILLVRAGPVTTGALLAVAAAVATSEYYRIVFGRVPALGWVGVVGATAVPIVGAVAPDLAPATVFAAAVVGTSMLAWTGCLLLGPRATAPEHAGHIVAGFLFTAGGFAALSVLRCGPGGAAWVLLVFAASWGNDAAAYFGGRLLGRHPISPVSPHKTWEGAVAGMVGGTAVLLVVRRWVPGLAVSGSVMLGILAGVAGPVGDFCKSLLKRAYQVKDSGHLIPGHGGLLDRVDAVLFNAVVVLVARSAVSTLS